jgi:hypothetical protein
MGVAAHRVGLAGVTARALVIIEPAGQEGARDVAVLLRMRVMTARARHAAVAITIAVQVSFLIGKRADAPIRQKRFVAELWQPDRVELGQRQARRVARPELVLQGVALPART